MGEAIRESEIERKLNDMAPEWVEVDYAKKPGATVAVLDIDWNRAEDEAKREAAFAGESVNKDGVLSHIEHRSRGVAFDVIRHAEEGDKVVVRAEAGDEVWDVKP